MRLDRAAAPFAEGQLGLATLHQMLDGVAASTVHQASESGRIQRLERSVYRMPGAPSTADTRVLAKVLSAGEGAMVSHRSAAWLWGLVEHAPKLLDVSVPRGRRPRTPGICLHQSSDLDLVIAGTVREVPVTDIGRTILDCAGVPGVDLELLIDAARRRYDISPTLLPWVVACHARSGRRGITALRHNLALAELPDSDFERLVVRWLRRLEFSGWELHHRLVIPGYGPCEPDVAWPAERVILELEGADHRDRATVHSNDTARQNALTLAGWRVLRTTYRRWLRHTEQVHAEIVAALAAAPESSSGDARRVTDASDVSGIER